MSIEPAAEPFATPHGAESAPIGPTRRGFVSGIWAAVPIFIAVIPFGMIFGTVAVEAGLTLSETMAYTMIVTAGASQLAALAVLDQGGPAFMAVLTGAIVNLRMAMYSASLAVHWRGVGMLWRVPAAFFLHDQAFALSMARYARADEPTADRVGFYFGVGITTTIVWIIATLVGALVGNSIPQSWGLDFVVPACFLAIAVPMIRGTANVVAALVAALLGVLCADMPGGSGLMLAAATGIAAGMATRRLMERRS
ncbi:MAG: AzlC family ABC transporter permease [Pseudomonadota bacterium]